MIKKIAILFICLSSLQVFAQSYSMYKGALVVEANVGVDIYGVTLKEQTKNINPVKDTTVHNLAASSNFNFGLEYGLSQWFGIGIKAKFDRYAASKDTTTHSTPTVRGIELAAVVNAHVVHVKHFDLPIGLDLGYSSLTDHENDVANTQIYGNGFYANLHINPRLYIGRFGFNLNMGVPFINYSLTSNNLNFNKYILADWKAVGFSLGFGIQYRFLKDNAQ
jgi:hypothetical protein